MQHIKPKIRPLQIEQGIRDLLQFVGENPDREGLQETPKRVLAAWKFWCSGYEQDPAEVLKTFDGEAYDELIFQGSLPYFSCCEHHLAAFFGYAHIAYIPNGRVVGLSKLGRLLEIYARRLQVQERLTTQVVDALMNHLGCKGAAVVTQARHHCYSEDTEVLTNHGFKRFEFLNESDLVAQFEHGQISFVRPTSYVVSRYSGPMHHWRSKSIDLLVTPEHRMLCQSEWKFQHGKNFEFVRVKEIDQAKVYLPSAGLYEGAPQKKVSIGSVELTEEQYCGLMGIYISDGSFNLNENCIVISKSEKNVKDYNPVREFLYSLPIPWKERRQIKGGHVTGFSCRGLGLPQYFSQFGKAFGKYLPLTVLHASSRARRNFLRLFLMGDGWSDPITCQIAGSSRSKALAEGLQQIFIGLGYGARMVALPAAGLPQYVVRGRIQKNKPKPFSSVKRTQQFTGDYSGMVYCANVPSGALVVRRDGCVSISGNCMESRGIQKIGTVTVCSAVRGLFKDKPEVRAEFMSLCQTAMSGIKIL